MKHAASLSSLFCPFHAQFTPVLAPVSRRLQAAVFGGFQKVGVGYPRGGPQRLATEMVESIEARGGAVFVRSPVARIILDDAGPAQ